MTETAVMVTEDFQRGPIIGPEKASPTPWTFILGLSIIKRAILTGRKAGLKRFLILTHPEHRHRIERLRKDRQLHDVTIECIVDSGDQLTRCLILVKDRIDGPFLLLSATHMCEAALLDTLRRQSLGETKAVLCIDRKIDETLLGRFARVSLRNGCVNDIGQTLPAYEAIDTEIRLYSPAVIKYAEALLSKSETDGSLYHLDRFLILQRGLVSYVDVSDLFWMKIRTAEDAKRADRILFRRGGKSTDGIYATFNKQVVGQPLIRFFLNTPITPNMISILGLGLGIFSGVIFSFGGYFNSLYGALLAYVSSIMDNVDGAVARLKHQESPFGTWLEMACDYASYLTIFTGMTIGLYRHTGSASYLYAGGLFVMGTILSFIIISYMRKRHSGEQPGAWVSKWHAKAEADRANPLSYFSRQAYFLTRRPVLPYYILFFTILNLTGVFLYLCAFGANLFWTLALYSNRLFKNPR